MRKLFVLLLVALVVTACSPAVTPTSAPAPAKAEPTQVPATRAPAKVEPTQAPAQSSGTGVTLPAVDPLKVTGDIISAGSSTVFPLSEAMAERFADEGYQGKITIDSIGSGAGFERFCKTGETDIANASRGIKEEEAELCAAINRKPAEFRVGTDAVAVVVSNENTFVKNVTMEELAKIFSNTTEKWSDVNPSWPAETILRFSPGTDSGTFDYFVEVVLGKQKQLLLDARNVQLSEDDNVLVQGVLGSPYAIGYFGFAYYHENADKMNVLSIEGVAPTAETVDKGTYKLARPLFLYTTAEIMKQKPQVVSFINFYLTNVNDLIGEVGYFPASDAVLDASREALLEATK